MPKFEMRRFTPSDCKDIKITKFKFVENFLLFETTDITLCPRTSSSSDFTILLSNIKNSILNISLIKNFQVGGI